MTETVSERRYRFDTDAPGYLYEVVAAHLMKRIAEGDLLPHEPLPSEQRLAREYGISLGTGRHATQLLRLRGLVITVRSKGTYVALTAQETARDVLRRDAHEPAMQIAHLVEVVR